MYSFTSFQQGILDRLHAQSSGVPVPMKTVLNQAFFTRDSGRALIVQQEAGYAVFFLDNNQHQDRNANGKAMAEFMELLALIDYLQKQGLIGVFGGKPDSDHEMFYIHETFTSPIISDQKIILNPQGDFTDHPETIVNKDNRAIFQGQKLTGDIYELISRNAIGTLVCTEAFGARFNPSHAEAVESSKPTAEGATSRTGRLLKWAVGASVAALVLLVAGMGAAGYLYLGNQSETGYPGSVSQEVSQHVDSIFSGIHAAIRKLESHPAGHLAHDSTAHQGELYGIDVSRWNGNVLTALEEAHNLSFVFVKATQGLSSVDRRFSRNWRLLEGENVARGCYHFYEVGADPKGQARHFHETIGPLRPHDLSPVVDIETASVPKGQQVDNKTLQKGLKVFLQELEKLTGRTPIIYSGSAFATTHLTDANWEKYPLWVAEYTSRQAPKLPGPWKQKGYAIWQKGHDYQLAKHHLDFDIMQVPLSTLQEQ